MINRSIARRYARALIDLVEAESAQISRQLSAFSTLVTDNPNLKEVLSNPAFSLQERSKVLQRILDTLGWAAPLNRLLGLLVERHRVAYLGAIADEFSRMVDEREGRLRVTVDSAVEVEPQAVEKLKKALAEGFSKQIVLEQRVNPELIAGIAVRVGGLVVDGSLASQLTRLKEQLRARA